MARQNSRNPLQQLPLKWAVAIVALLIVYTLTQPLLNSRLGWNLPSLASLLGEEDKQPSAESRGKNENAKRPQNKNDGSAGSESTNADDQSDSGLSRRDASTSRAEEPSATKGTSAEGSGKQKSKQKTAPSTSPTEDKASEPQPTQTPEPGSSKGLEKTQASGSAKLIHGYLSDTGGKRYLSPAGLIYGPGSEEGHRIEHLRKHMEDIPNRPGKHGVFDGDLTQVLRWIDDAYDRAKRGVKGVRKNEEGERTVIEAPFDMPIGYIGGRDGKRANHPDAKRLRLVIEDNRFVTAFPF